MALVGADRDEVIEATVEALDQVRSAYLGTPGANVLRHWDQIQARTRSAARTSTSVAEFMTSLSRSLQLGAPDSYLSRSISELTTEVEGRGATREWLDLVEREYAHLLALVRLRTETRADARKAKGDRK